VARKTVELQYDKLRPIKIFSNSTPFKNNPSASPPLFVHLEKQPDSEHWFLALNRKGSKKMQHEMPAIPKVHLN
jgi:hypothetical protein